MNQIIPKNLKLLLVLASTLLAIGLLLPQTVAAQSYEIQDLIVEVDGDDAKLSWFTPVETTGCVEFGQTSEYGLEICDNDFDRLHEVVLQNLDLRTIYHFRLVAKNRLNEQVVSFGHTFETERERKDGKAPEIEDVRVIWIGATAFTVTWQTNEPANSRINFGTDPSNLRGGASSRGDVTDHEVTARRLQPGTIYYFQVSSEDDDDIVARSNVQQLRTVFGKSTDDAPLQIQDLRPVSSSDDAIGLTSATFTWTTSRPAEATLRYGTQSNRLNKRVTIDNPRRLKHKVFIEGLESGTAYFFRVEARDVLGKRTESPGADGVHSFITRGVRGVSVNNSPGSSRRTRSSSSFSAGRHFGFREPAPYEQKFGFRNSNSNGRAFGFREPQPYERKFGFRNQPETKSAEPVVAGVSTAALPKALGAFTYIYTPATALLKSTDNPQVYAVLNGFKHRLKNATILQSYGYRDSDIKVVTPAGLERLPDLRLAKKPSSPDVYYIDEPSNQKILVPSAAIFNSYASNAWADVVILNPQDLDSFEVATLVRTPDNPQVYLLEHGKRRPIMSAAAFSRNGFDWDKIMLVNEEHLETIQLGEVIN